MGRQHNNGNGALGTSALDQLGQKLTEACYELWDNAVDPEEAFLGSDGERWIPVGDQPGGSRTAQAGITNEQQLSEIRRQCRALAAGNEFAINGHENRINYPLHPERNASLAEKIAPPEKDPVLVFWHDAPTRKLGSHDGRPDRLREREDGKES